MGYGSEMPCTTQMERPRFMIAAASSGSGKTVISCALMSALKQKGMKVAACKCGPDYIDPMFHREVLGFESENLDLYFCGADTLKHLFQKHIGDSDVAVVEGVMGYYDGMSLASEKASSYDVARTLGIPVILVVPCKGMALSIIPQILGMIDFRKDSNIRGVLLNQIPNMLYPKMKRMIEEELGKRGYAIPVVGYIPEDDVFRLESRHLGLVTPAEVQGIRKQLEEAGNTLCRTVDLERILDIGKSLGRQCETVTGDYVETFENKVKIGIARDEAFCFYYKDNIELLQKLGCELVWFSPLHDSTLPEGIQGLILGGGYPELYTEGLSANRRMCESIFGAIKSGVPCLAECGGFMYLHEEMEGKDGIKRPMAGIVKGSAFMTKRLSRFGYIELQALKDGVFFQKGDILRGHEFHYWDSTDNGADCLAVKPDKKRSWECIHMSGNLFAGYPHIHFYSNPSFASRFVESCRKWNMDENK